MPMFDITELVGHWGYLAVFVIVVVGNVECPCPKTNVAYAQPRGGVGNLSTCSEPRPGTNRRAAEFSHRYQRFPVAARGLAPCLQSCPGTVVQQWMIEFGSRGHLKKGR